MPDGPKGVKRGIFFLRGLEMTRLETFTDAAFAFALTLLVISLEPPTSLSGLIIAMKGIPAFVASGALLMVFWWGHHEWSRRYGLDDGPAVILSCILVFTVMVYVVPLRFMFSVFFSWIGRLTGLPLVTVTGPDLGIPGGPHDLNTMFLLYGLGFTAMAGSLVLLYTYAWRQRQALELSEEEAFETLSEAGVWGIVAATGLLSAFLAVVLTPSFFAWPGWAYMLLPIVTPAFATFMNRRRDRLFSEGEA